MMCDNIEPLLSGLVNIFDTQRYCEKIPDVVCEQSKLNPASVTQFDNVILCSSLR